MKHHVLIGCLVSAVCLAIGCSKDEMQSSSHEHHHVTTDHMPSSLGDLSGKIQERLDAMKNGHSSPQLQSQLTDLVSWAPEFAADTDIEESLWINIYEASERARFSIQKETKQWDEPLIDMIAQLCRLSEDAWMSLAPDKRIERYQDHDHHHHHHEHADHEHADHEHADHEHADHEHADHEHADHEHADHEPKR